MLDMPLSAEAKAVVASASYSGVSPEVSTAICLKDEVNVDQEILRKLLISGWGEEIAPYITIAEAQATDEEALRFAQFAVRSGAALIAVSIVRTKNYSKIYLSAHHALADEYSLEVISRLVRLAYSGMIESAIYEMIQGRQLYHSYVERQRMLAKDGADVQETECVLMSPVRISKTGRLAWSEESPRICLNHVVNTEKNSLKEKATSVLLSLLHRSGEVAEGNTVCMSKCWRLTHESGAIGMMTGLTPLPVEDWTSSRPLTRSSLEAQAKFSSGAREALKCCRESELFVNGAFPRGIPASLVVGTAFPVGVDVRQISDSELFLEIEGRFCNKDAASEFLYEWAYILSG